jgi:hypothetical protein
MTVLAERIRVAAAHSASTPASSYKEGEYWTIAFAASDFRLKDERGLAYIAYLLARPNEQIHPLELDAAGYPRASEGSSATRLGHAAPVTRHPDSVTPASCSMPRPKPPHVWETISH